MVSTWSRGTGSSSGMSRVASMRRRSWPSGRGGAAGPGAHGVARVEDHRAAALHEGVELAHRRLARVRPAGHDRPVEQRDRRRARRAPDRRRSARPAQGRAAAEHLREAGEAGLARVVDLRVAGDDIGEPRHQRRVDARRAIRRLRACGVGRRRATATRRGATSAGRGGAPARRRRPNAAREMPAEPERGERVDEEKRAARAAKSGPRRSTVSAPSSGCDPRAERARSRGPRARSLGAERVDREAPSTGP